MRQAWRIVTLHRQHLYDSDAFYTTKSSGVGMGLSICRSIIAAHGGRLWAEANEPRGAVFQFTLPGAQKIMNFLHSFHRSRELREDTV
jgi:signal transduction histidine kinase